MDTGELVESIGKVLDGGSSVQRRTSPLIASSPMAFFGTLLERAR